MTATAARTSATPSTKATPDTEVLTGARAADTAADLLNAMAAMPTNHPSRPALRDRAIEAWLPLAK
ncbi:MAG TPA: RNA polymerase sigma factor SigF, partial [Actinoplanes sp.]|nr:RNA polymerase sigma factor SigF [Actinoplanes sp.]